MAEVEPVKLTPKQIDEKSITDGVPLRHAGWEELPDATANGVWPLSLAVVFYSYRDLAHTREQWERFRVWGRALWRDPIDERQFSSLDRAEAQLRTDLASGIVRAFGHKMGPSGPEHTVRPVPPEIWDQFQFGIRFDLSVAGNSDRALYSGVTVLRHEVVPLLIAETATTAAAPEMRGRHDEPAPKRGGGRPLRYDWDAMWIEVIRLATEDNITDRPALNRHLLEWFTNRSEHQPGETIFKEKMSKLFTTLGWE